MGIEALDLRSRFDAPAIVFQILHAVGGLEAARPKRKEDQEHSWRFGQDHYTAGSIMSAITRRRIRVHGDWASQIHSCAFAYVDRRSIRFA